jgi:hypothetical protein
MCLPVAFKFTFTDARREKFEYTSVFYCMLQVMRVKMNIKSHKRKIAKEYTHTKKKHQKARFTDIFHHAGKCEMMVFAKYIKEIM